MYDLERNVLFAFALITGVLCAGESSAQVMDSYFVGKHSLTLATSTSYEEFGSFYRGGELRSTPGALGTIRVISVNWSAQFGLTDNLDIFVNLPYIMASGSGDGPADQSGFQDLSMFSKYRMYNAASHLLGGGRFQLVSCLGLQLPLHQYVTNAPIALGHGSVNVDARLLAAHRWFNGLTLEAQSGWIWKSGRVPNAVPLSASLSYAFPRFWVGTSLEQVWSLGGKDIGPDVDFVETAVNYTKARAALFVPITTKIGVSAGGSYLLHGKNIGRAWASFAGVSVSL